MAAAALGLLALLAATALVVVGGAPRFVEDLERRGSPRSHDVEIRGFVFLPESLAVAPGDTIVWTNHDLVPHTATSTNGSWDSGQLPPEASWRLVVKEGGAYMCALHPSMRGVLVLPAPDDGRTSESPGTGAR